MPEEVYINISNLLKKNYEEMKTYDEGEEYYDLLDEYNILLERLSNNRTNYRAIQIILGSFLFVSSSMFFIVLNSCYHK